MERSNMETARAMLKPADTRRVIEALKNGTADLTMFYAPDVVLEQGDFGMPDMEDEYHGIDGMRTFWMEWLASWETVDWQAELHDAGEQVVAVVEQRMAGAASGAEVTLRYGQVLRFREGKVVYWRVFPDPSDAFQAAGIEPPG